MEETGASHKKKKGRKRGRAMVWEEIETVDVSI